MSIHYDDIYQRALELPPKDRQRLADALIGSPSGLMADHIITTLNAQAEKLHELGVKRIGLFGSHGRGEARLDSDIDLLVEMATNDHTLFDVLRIGVYLEEVFGRKVDVGTLDSLRPEVRSDILAEVVYAEGV
ncbi:nucleotidyltransferase family protein [Chloroflexota bacterium]